MRVGIIGFHSVTYHDSRFGFAVTPPDGWRAEVYQDVRPDMCGGYIYVVYIFPPGSHGYAMLAAQEHEPELMSIQVIPQQCQPSSDRGEVDPTLVRDPRPLTIAGASATLYTRQETHEIGSGVTVTLRGHVYFFDLQAPPDKARDADLFLSMLRSFTFSGA